MFVVCGECGEIFEEVLVCFWDVFQEQNFEGVRNLIVDVIVVDLCKLFEVYAFE